jgi:hypothetical protein
MRIAGEGSVTGASLERVRCLMKDEIRTRKSEYNGQTFIVEIKRQEYGSWQGAVTWVQGQKKQSFRSALELIKLMDSTMEVSEPQWEDEESGIKDTE